MFSSFFSKKNAYNGDEHLRRLPVTISPFKAQDDGDEGRRHVETFEMVTSPSPDQFGSTRLYYVDSDGLSSYGSMSSSRRISFGDRDRGALGRDYDGENDGMYEDYEEVEDDYEGTSPVIDRFSARGARRWSIFEKLERRHYCSVRNCSDCFRILNCKCMLATLMLFMFVALCVAFVFAVFNSSNDSDNTNNDYWNGFDFIVIGGGPAGSTVTRRLVDEGASVLLLEAGSASQYDLGGGGLFWWTCHKI